MKAGHVVLITGLLAAVALLASQQPKVNANIGGKPGAISIGKTELKPNPGNELATFAGG